MNKLHNFFLNKKVRLILFLIPLVLYIIVIIIGVLKLIPQYYINIFVKYGFIYLIFITLILFNIDNK